MYYTCRVNNNSKECDKKIISKCGNCVRANKNLNMGLMKIMSQLAECLDLTITAYYHILYLYENMWHN